MDLSNSQSLLYYKQNKHDYITNTYISQRERERERERERQTDRQTNKQREREREREDTHTTYN